MHLADGIIAEPLVLVGGNLLGAASVGVAMAHARVRCPRYAAWTGTLAALVLGAQAINLPLLPGASAHALGAGLLTLTLGSAGAILALFAVLVVQALLLGDGGLTVLGINALNIAILPVLTVAIARQLFGESKRGLMAAAFVGTLVGSALGGSSLAGMLILGADASPKLTALWLIGGEAVAGALEGVLTAIGVQHLVGAAPRLLRRQTAHTGPKALDDDALPEGGSSVRALFGTAAVALVLAAALLPFASGAPDLLEVVLRHLETSP